MTGVVLYLDFDGVLHPFGEDAIDDYGQLLANPNLFCWLPTLTAALDPFPNVRIIVSSDWRRLFVDATLIRLLGPLGSRFAGIVETRFPNRADEIQADAMQRGISAWLALDDHQSVVEAAKGDGRFVVCQPELGVSEEAVIERLVRGLRGMLE